MEADRSHLVDFKKRWQLLVYLEGALYAFGSGCLVYLITNSQIFGLLSLLLVFLIVVVIKHPWRINLKRTSNYIDAHVSEASFSSGLLLEPEENLSNLSKLQRYRVAEELQKRLKTLTPPNKLIQAVLVMLFLMAIGFLAHQLELFNQADSIFESRATPERIQFIATDTILSETVVPKLKEQVISISYPRYTGKATKTTADPNVKAVVNSRIRWHLQFDNPVSEVYMKRMGETLPLKKVDGSYRIDFPLETSGFYSFNFSNADGTEFTSDIYALEAIPDTPPEIEVVGIPQYSYFDFSESKVLQMQSTISDDFGIGNAYIVATVSKGSGESVKFREAQLEFREPISKGQNVINVSRTLDMDALKMEVGDELYFYVEAYDEKEPKPNVTRSETFFAVIKDTVTDQFAVQGTLGVDQMPDYFRSQRQLIMDTEKLIRDKPNIAVEEFKSRSNELGFDQKALRLKYGQFMGDESEMGIAPMEAISEELGEEGRDHEDGEENVLEDYSHNHDGPNEHNLVAVEDTKESEDPLHDYLHNHDNPEASTLFEESLKSKLRKALTIMWDAELHLRLYEPEKSLPFQYEALKLIQEIKNSARIYVHRIGFDPPPIKEDRRLTGSIKEVDNFQKQAVMEVENPFEAMKIAVFRLETLSQAGDRFTEKDKQLFTDAGNELAQMAIENPGKYLTILQRLKGIQDNTQRYIPNYKAVQRGLLSALPRTEQIPGVKSGYEDKINSIFLNQLETYD